MVTKEDNAITKIRCDCCGKYFSKLWKDYRTQSGVTGKVYSCNKCINLTDVDYEKNKI